MNLSACTQLKTLNIIFNPDYLKSPEKPLSWKTLSYLVDSASHATLQTVELCIISPQFLFRNAADPDNALDVALASFPALTHVEFEFSKNVWGHVNPSDITAELIKVFPRASRKARVIATLR